MLGPRMVVLMLLPAVVGAVILLLTRGRRRPASRVSIRGLWLLAPVVAVTVGANVARGASQHDHGINRVEGALVLAASIAFVVLNRRADRGPVASVAVLGTGLGGALNAAAALIAGGMPVLMASARVAGYDYVAGDAPPSDYVFSDHLPLPVILLGDFIAIPGFLKVLSIGDLLLLPGLAALVVVAVRNVRVTAAPLAEDLRPAPGLRTDPDRREVKP